MNIKVYRYEVETSLGYHPGPYTAHRIFGRTSGYFELCSKMIPAHGKGYHPSIRIDINNFDGHFCACQSPEQLRQWFKGYNTPLKRLGFKIYEYTLSKQIKGKSGLQIGFKQEWVISKILIG